MLVYGNRPYFSSSVWIVEPLRESVEKVFLYSPVWDKYLSRRRSSRNIPMNTGSVRDHLILIRLISPARCDMHEQPQVQLTHTTW